MIANVTFVCDAPGCRSYVTIHPEDAKDPADALAKRGWTMYGQKTVPGGKVSGDCYCPFHGHLAPKGGDGVPAGD